MLVSVVVPTYKRKIEIVRRAIESIINQTYKEIEIILVDDNADEKLKIFRHDNRKYAEATGIVFVENQKNLGGALTRNEGIKRASGEYIAFLDDDDIYLPEKIQRQLKYMLDNDLDVSFSDVAIFNEKNNLIDYRDHNKLLKNPDLMENGNLFKYHLTYQIAGTISFMYKKSALVKIGGFDDAKMGQEYYLMSKTLLENFKIGYLPEANSKMYRTNMEAISTGPNKIIGEKTLYNYKKSFFYKLNLWSRSYIRCRHYAVMAVAYKRNRKNFAAFINLLIACFSNPFIVLAEMFSFVKRKNKINKAIKNE